MRKRFKICLILLSCLLIQRKVKCDPWYKIEPHPNGGSVICVGTDKSYPTTTMQQNANLAGPGPGQVQVAGHGGPGGATALGNALPRCGPVKEITWIACSTSQFAPEILSGLPPGTTFHGTNFPTESTNNGESPITFGKYPNNNIVPSSQVVTTSVVGPKGNIIPTPVRNPNNIGPTIFPNVPEGTANTQSHNYVPKPSGTGGGRGGSGVRGGGRGGGGGLGGVAGHPVVGVLTGAGLNYMKDCMSEYIKPKFAGLPHPETPEERLKFSNALRKAYGLPPLTPEEEQIILNLSGYPQNDPYHSSLDPYPSVPDPRPKGDPEHSSLSNWGRY